MHCAAHQAVFLCTKVIVDIPDRCNEGQYWYFTIQFTVVTWAQVVYLICTPVAREPRYSYYATLPKANSLNANTTTTTGFFIYARLKGPGDYGYAAVTL